MNSTDTPKLPTPPNPDQQKIAFPEPLCEVCGRKTFGGTQCFMCGPRSRDWDGTRR